MTRSAQQFPVPRAARAESGAGDGRCAGSAPGPSPVPPVSPRSRLPDRRPGVPGGFGDGKGAGAQDRDGAGGRRRWSASGGAVRVVDAGHGRGARPRPGNRPGTGTLRRSV
ncbi:hypothetical protein GCM10010358_45330 [Streptomyces minutiscleroticus]|uniref:Uncharacterized protein n=1 Tax=Streptomyces minutiscleroticus TaxID=68238 RepID=A0A918NPM4_9ACTN|nr:hypothetical protein GCM10010358_45330 [Streptomyces minutiscleroticus]